MMCARGKRRMFFNSQKRGSPLLWSNLLGYSCSFTLVSPEVLRQIRQHAGDQMAGSNGTCCPEILLETVLLLSLSTYAGGCLSAAKPFADGCKLSLSHGTSCKCSSASAPAAPHVGMQPPACWMEYYKTSSRYHIAKQWRQERGVSTNRFSFSGQPAQLSIVVASLFIINTSFVDDSETFKILHYSCCMSPPFLLPSLLSLNDTLFSQFLWCSSVVSGWKIIPFFFFLNNCSGNVCAQTVHYLTSYGSSVSRNYLDRNWCCWINPLSLRKKRSDLLNSICKELMFNVKVN